VREGLSRVPPACLSPGAVPDTGQCELCGTNVKLWSGLEMDAMRMAGLNPEGIEAARAEAQAVQP